MIITGYTDTDLINYLQDLTDKAEYTGRVVLRKSTTDRGWRLHETSRLGSKSVRQAIVNFIENEKNDNKNI